MIVLQATPTTSPLPPGAPWWAHVGYLLGVLLISAATTIAVARITRPKPPKKGEKDPVATTLSQHGATLADHETRIVDAENVLSESTDPGERKRDHTRGEQRISAVEVRLTEAEREARAADRARHEADAKMQATIARIEGNQAGQEKRRWNG